jgi:hypothetical protein
MKYKMGFALLGVMLVAQVGFASPLTDYSVGKVSLDLNFVADNTVKVTNKVADYPNSSLRYSAKKRLDYNLMAGLGQGYGIQYRNTISDSDMAYNNDTDNVSKYKIKFQEFNVLKSLDKRSAIFVGVVQASSDFSVQDPLDTTSTFNVSSDKKTVWQIGYIGKAPLTKDLNAYGVVAVGNHLTNYEIGLAQKLNNNMEFNISYREKKVRDLHLYDDSVGAFSHDVTVHGMCSGVTYIF